MKHLITFLFLLCANFILAQDYFTEFINACESNDTSMQIEILEKWENENPNDPELFTSRFNYHFTKSQQEVLELNSGKLEGEGLVIQDDEGNNVGHLGSTILFDSTEVDKAISYIDKGISQNPNRLDMRFGKIFLFGQMKNWHKFSNEIIKVIEHSAIKDSEWLWTNNEKQEGNNEFMLSVIQDYQLQLYNTQDDDLLLNMRDIATSVLEFYPEHIESLSNLAITYQLRGESEKALVPLLKAESLNPEDYIIIANIANTYKMMDKKEKSIEYYEKLIKHSDKEEGIADYAKEQIALLKK